jgi:hypothetical protein
VGPSTALMEPRAGSRGSEHSSWRLGGRPFDSRRSLPSTSLREPRAWSRGSGHSTLSNGT